MLHVIRYEYDCGMRLVICENITPHYLGLVQDYIAALCSTESKWEEDKAT